MEVSKLDITTVNQILDELMRAAVDGGVGSVRCERVGDAVSALSHINVRGRLLARIRKASLHHVSLEYTLTAIDYRS